MDINRVGHKGRRRWTEYEVQYLIKHYATRTNADLAEWVHHSPCSVLSKAFELGLRKSKEFLRERREPHLFKKGYTPHNKGRAQAEWMSAEGRRKAIKTQFKPGAANPYNPSLREPGFESVRTEHGRQIIWIKPPDGRRMMPKHRYIWEQAYGPIPKGHNVQFRDGNTLNCVLENLYLISRARQVRKNYDDLPAEVKAAYSKRRNEKRNKSIRADRLRLKWGLEPKGRLVKRIPKQKPQPVPAGEA